MSEPTPTEMYFPERNPPDPGDIIARVLAGIAIVLAVGFHVAEYSARSDEVNRDRKACLRDQRDLRVEAKAWQTISTATGLEDPGAVADRLERSLKRSCEDQYPEAKVLW